MNGKVAIRVIAVASLLVHSVPGIASQGVTYQSLRQACSAVIQIYEAREQERLLAGITTSRSEAMRAGYCKGVIESYQLRLQGRCRVDWYVQAVRIGRSEGPDNIPIDDVLRRTCASQ